MTDLLQSKASASLALIFRKGPGKLLTNRSRNEAPNACSQWSPLLIEMPSFWSTFSMMHECSPVKSLAVCLLTQPRNVLAFHPKYQVNKPKLYRSYQITFLQIKINNKSTHLRYRGIKPAFFQNLSRDSVRPKETPR